MPDLFENHLQVTFAEHIPSDRIAGMVSGIAAYGNVESVADGRIFSVEVFRRSNLPGLKEQLLRWEQYGFLRWKQG